MGIRIHTAWNLIGSISPLLLGIVTLPYIYNEMGIERVGVLTLIWALIGYFSIFDFGLGRALTQRIATYEEKISTNNLENTINTGIIISFILGVFGLIITIVSVSYFGVELIQSSQDLEKEIQISMMLACLGIPATTMTAAYRGVLEGRQKFRAVNVLRLILGMSNFLGPCATIYFIGLNLAYTVTILLIVRYIMLAVHHLSCQQAVSIKIKLHFSTGEVSKFLKYMGWITVSNLVSPLMVLFDRFLISSILGAGVVAFYTIPADILARLLLLPVALTSSLFPLFSMMHSRSQYLEGARLYRKSMLLIFVIMTFTSCVIIAGGELGLALWMGDDFAEKAAPIASVLTVGILFNSLAQVPHAYIQATGDAKSTALIHITEATIYFPLLVLMVYSYGLVGVAIAWTSRACLDLLLLHMRAQMLQNKL